MVGDPRNNTSYGEDEAREIAALLHARPLIGDKANKTAVRSRLLKASIAHLATHAYFAPGSPSDSCPAGDKAFALREAVSTVRAGGWTHPHYWSAFVLFGDSSGVLPRQ